jgi:hypothetical protein
LSHGASSFSSSYDPTGSMSFQAPGASPYHQLGETADAGDSFPETSYLGLHKEKGEEKEEEEEEEAQKEGEGGWFEDGIAVIDRFFPDGPAEDA